MKNSLSKRKLERYSRQIILKDIGILGQKKIINSKVLIVGIGGLGSPVADLLARCGVGHIGAIDHDKVDISNLQRGVDSANRSLGSINTKGSRAFGNMAKSVAATTAKITALASAIGGLGVAQIAQVGMRFEDLDDSLNRVFGSLQGGREAFSQIQTFAQTTPFSIETVTKAFIGLKSAGIEPNMKMLQTFADTASVSTDQLGTFETLIRITQRSAGGGLGLEELNQISDRGIDIFSGLSKTLGKSRDELSKLGQTAEGIEVLERIMDMNKQSISTVQTEPMNKMSLEDVRSMMKDPRYFDPRQRDMGFVKRVDDMWARLNATGQI